MMRDKVITPCVGVICFRGEDVLLIKRRKPPRQGEWSIPGGHIEFGEKAAQAALRELFEETGVHAELLGLVDVIDGIFPSQDADTLDRHYLLCDYAARWISGEPQAGSDALHAEFVAKDTLATLPLWQETRDIISKAQAFVSSEHLT